MDFSRVDVAKIDTSYRCPGKIPNTDIDLGESIKHLSDIARVEYIAGITLFLSPSLLHNARYADTISHASGVGISSEYR